MPPTPFQPSHQTPFKSTISTSQQARVHHTPFEGTTQLSVQDLVDPSDWRYHAEGGKNVLFSFSPRSTSPGEGESPFATPACTYALRIPKSLPSTNPFESPDDDEEEAELFTQQVITPLLGPSAILPKTIKIAVRTARDRSIIDTLAGSIEMQRPAARRAQPARIRAEALTYIYAVQDVTAPILCSSASTSAAGVLSVEIKPKWGFLPRTDSLPPSSPNIELKAKYSRYRMHRVAKAKEPGESMTKEPGESMTKEKFDALYDPLDLYSQDEGRKKKAIKALWDDWKQTGGKTNNFRLFWNGQLVHPDDQNSLKRIASFLGTGSGEEELLGALTMHLFAELSKSWIPSGDGAHLWKTPLPPSNGGGGDNVLSRLAHLQASLDPLDAEGLAHLWLQRTQSHTLGQHTDRAADLPPALTSFLPSSQLYPILETFLSANKVDTADVKLEDAVQAFLVSASFKDCSLLIRFFRQHGGEAVVGETKLVDLDRKPFAKLASMQKTDSEVCAAFLAWLETLDAEPKASVSP